MMQSRRKLTALLASLAWISGIGTSLQAEAPLEAQWASTAVPFIVRSMALNPSDQLFLYGEKEADGSKLLQKYNGQGELLWAAAPQLEDSSDSSLAPDHSGCVMLAGLAAGSELTYGNVRFGPWPQRAGGMVLVKYAAQGQVQWAQASFQTGVDRHGAYDCFTAVAVDAAGELYAAGRKHQKGPGYRFFGDQQSVQDVVDSLGPILMRFRSSGQPQWARMVRGEAATEITSLAVDGASNAFATVGVFGQGTVDFGDGVQTAGRPKVGSFVLVKYSPAGKAFWARCAQPSGGHCEARSLSIDRLGNAYIAGLIHGQTLLDFGNGITVTGSSTKRSPLLVKFSASGDPQWAQCPSVPAEDDSLILVRAGQTGVYTITGSGLVQAFDPAGAFQWELRLPGRGYIQLLAVDRWENIYLAGRTLSEGSTDLGKGIQVKVKEQFVAKYENTSFASMKRASATQARVRVRSRGDLQADPLGYLDKGDLVEILEQSQEKMKIQTMEDYWYRVRRMMDGLTGWCFGFYLELEGS